MRAGDQWRTHARADECEQQFWDAQTYREWMDIVRRGDGEKAGLGVSNTFRSYVCYDLIHGVRWLVVEGFSRTWERIADIYNGCKRLFLLLSTGNNRHGHRFWHALCLIPPKVLQIV